MAYNPEATRYKIVPANAKDYVKSLTVPQQRGVVELVAASIRADFPERTEDERMEFEAQAQRVRHNPNNAVGGLLLRRRQAYRNTHHVLAIRGDEVVAHLPVADNASSKRGGVKGFAEMQGKLHFKELGGKDWIGHRYFWLGYAAMSPDIRDRLMNESTDEVNELDVMVSLGGLGHDYRQPVSTYPWTEENPWKAAVAGMGLNQDLEYGEDIRAFGATADPVHQEHWTADPYRTVEEIIFAKNGAEEAIGRARNQLA